MVPQGGRATCSPHDRQGVVFSGQGRDVSPEGLRGLWPCQPTAGGEASSLPKPAPQGGGGGCCGLVGSHTNPLLNKGLTLSVEGFTWWIVSSSSVVVDIVETKVPKPPFTGLFGSRNALGEISGRNLEKTQVFLVDAQCFPPPPISFNCCLGLNANYQQLLVEKRPVSSPGFSFVPRGGPGRSGVSDPKGMSRLGESSKCYHVTRLGSCQENPIWISILSCLVPATLVVTVQGGVLQNLAICFPSFPSPQVIVKSGENPGSRQSQGR